MLVLRTLLLSPLHGYGISKAIHANSNEALEIEFGSLYPALKRLEAKGWLFGEVGSLREQSQGEILPPDSGRPETASTGAFEMG